MENTIGIPHDKIDKEGSLHLYNNKKKKWITRWVILCGSAIYYQKKKGDEIFEGPILIKDGSITVTNEQPNAKKRKISFKIYAKQLDGTMGTFFFSVPDEERRKEWMAAFKINTSKESIDIITKVKQGTAMRMKRNVSSAVAVSSGGKDLIRKFVGKKAIIIIEIVKDVVFKFSSDKKKVTEIENAIIKVAVKAILLWENKDITEKDVDAIIPLIRNLWIDLLNYCQMPFTYDHASIKTHGDELSVAFSNVLLPHVSENTLQLLHNTILYLEQKALLDIIFEDELQDAMRKEIVNILNTEWAKQRFKVMYN